MSLFRRKSCGLAAGGDRGRSQPQTSPRRGQPHAAGHRRHHRRRDLRADRSGRGQLRRAGHRLLVHPGRRRLRIRRTVLRRVRGDDPDLRVGVHLRLRHARGIRRLDHRLGPHPGIPLRGQHGRGGLVGLHGLAAQGHGDQHSRGIHRSALYPHRGGGRAVVELLEPLRPWMEQDRKRDQRPGDVHRVLHHGPAGDRHQGVGQLQQRHRRHQDDGDPGLHRLRHGLHQPGELGALRPGRYRTRPLRHRAASPGAPR